MSEEIPVYPWKQKIRNKKSAASKPKPVAKTKSATKYQAAHQKKLYNQFHGMLKQVIIRLCITITKKTIHGLIRKPEISQISSSIKTAEN